MGTKNRRRHMASKIESVIDYIAKLGQGEKVSVRGLAQELGVSEGTAYKSIKAAEAQGLVITRPKAGTVRINITGVMENGETTLAEAARSVGAVCLCGSEAAMKKPLPTLVVCDGSLEQFGELVRRYGRQVLCLVGNRPEFHNAAVEHGTDILLTGGAAMDERLLIEAENAGLCVFGSEQDTSTLMGMLNRRMANGLPKRELSAVRDWMQLPRYLYHDDMVAEWHRVYSNVFYSGSNFAVVDDSLKIRGTVDAQIAMTSAPSVRLSEIMDKPDENSIVDENMNMDELADRMIKSNRLFATVTSGDGMSGFIDMNDVVRYYKYNQSFRNFGTNDEGVLHVESDEEENRKRFYTVQIKETNKSENKNIYVNYIFSAAIWHAYDFAGTEVYIESGSFYSLAPIAEAGEYMISSEVIRQKNNNIVIELEMFNNDDSYYRCTVNVYANDNGTAQDGQRNIFNIII